MARFGWAAEAGAPTRLLNVSNQTGALRELATLAMKSSIDPLVVQVARTVIGDCPARNDECEIQCVFDSVKFGASACPAAGRTPLARGLRYVNDPVYSDLFIAPPKLLRMCAEGANSADCDEAASLIAALLSALGYNAGLRAWGKIGEDFSHVYAVVEYPKHEAPEKTTVLGLDSTVPESRVGWEPPGGHVLTALILE